MAPWCSVVRPHHDCTSRWRPLAEADLVKTRNPLVLEELTSQARSYFDKSHHSCCWMGLGTDSRDYFKTLCFSPLQFTTWGLSGLAQKCSILWLRSLFCQLSLFICAALVSIIPVPELFHSFCSSGRLHVSTRCGRFHHPIPDSVIFIVMIQRQSYVLRCSAAGEKESPCRASTVWKESRGLCIIDEALYRQTKLNTEMLAALPRRTLVVGGECGGGSKHRHATSWLPYRICGEDSQETDAGVEIC